MIIAAVCEFLGAVLLGANVTDTIKSNIAKQAPFVNQPELLMFGMFMVLCTACIWDNLACHLELPVSTTHTTSKQHLELHSAHTKLTALSKLVCLLYLAKAVT